LDRDPVPDDAPGGPYRRILRDFSAIAFDNANCPTPPPKPDAPKPTLAAEKHAAKIESLTAAIRKSGLPVLGIDDCSPPLSFSDLAKQGHSSKTLSLFSIGSPEAPKRLPGGRPPYENPANIETLSDVKNALWLRSPRAYSSKEEWLLAMGKSNADLIVVDAFFKADQPLNRAEVAALKYKFMGSRRLVLADINLSAARDDRFYWKREWRVGEPAFLREPQPGVPTGILVNYWDPAWKEILGIHFKGLIDLGFDGVLVEGMNAADRPEHEVFLE
jgi:cysteinyl-tRNA synthetase, unknown class